MTTPSYVVDGAILRPNIPALPKIKIASARVKIDPAQLASALARLTLRSSTARSELSWAASEGIALYEVTGRQARGHGVSADAGGCAKHRGWNSASGRFNDSAELFELRAYVVIDKYLYPDGTVDYDGLATTIVHEGVLHPRYGRHDWGSGPRSANAIANDDVYRRHFAIESERGRILPVTTSLSALYVGSDHPALYGSAAISVSGYKRLLRDAGKDDAYLEANPQYFTGAYSYTDSSALR